MATSSRSEHIHEILSSIGTVSRQLNVRGEYPFRKLHLGRPQMDILFTLSEQKQCSLQELASVLSVSPSAATQFVEDLYEKKLVTKKVNPADKRGRIIELSKGAQKEAQQFRQGFIQGLEKRFENMSEQELENLRDLLKKMRGKK